MSDFRFEFPDVEDGDRRRAVEDLAKSKDPSFTSVVKAAIDSESLTKNLYEASGTTEYVDPNWKLDAEWMREQAQARGIPEEYLSPLGDAVSQAHAVHLLDRIRSELDAKETLAQAGWGGVAAAMLVSVADPVTLAATALPGGQAAWLTKGGMVKAALKGGFVAGMSNAALEAGLAKLQLTRDPEDMYLAAVAGFGLGAGIGSLAGLATKNAQNLWHNTTLRRVREEPVLEAPSQADAPVRRPLPVGHATSATLDAFTPEQARTIALDRVRPGVLKDLEDAAGEVDPKQLDDMKAELTDLEFKAQELQQPGAKTLREAGGAFDPILVAGRAAKLREEIAAVEKALDSRVQAEAIKQGHVPPALDTATAAEVEKLLGVAKKKPLAEAMRDILNRGDNVEWDGPNGLERGTVVSKSDGQLLIEDAKGQARVFRATEQTPEQAEEAGAKFLGGSIGSGQVGQIDAPKSRFLNLKIGKVNIKTRFDSFARFDRSENQSLRRLAALLLDDPVGKQALKDVDGKPIHIENPMSAGEYAEMEFKRYYAQVWKVGEDAYSEWAKGLTVAERLTKRREFFNLVSRVTRDTTGELGRANPEAAKAAAGMATVRTAMLKRMQELGVEGADEVAENASYLNRRYKWDRIAMMGADPEVRPHMQRLLSEAILKVRPDMPAERAASIGKTFLKRLRELQTDPKQIGFLSDQGFERLAAALRQSGVEDDMVDDILGFVFNQKKLKEGDSGAHPRLKKRAFLDETHEVSWTDKDGNTRKLRFDDLLENDVRVLNDIYFRQTSGLIALARKGIRSKADYAALRKAAQEEAVTKGHLAEDVNRDLEDMDRVMRHVLGQPMYDGLSSNVTKGLRILRNFNVATSLAQVGFAQITEMGQLLSLKTVMAMRTNMSAFDKIMGQLERGAVDASLVRDLRAMGVVAEDAKLRRPYMKDYDPHEAVMGRADDLAALGSQKVLQLSGMNVITEFEREAIAKMYTQRLLNIAVGAEKLDDGLKARLATNGLAGDELDDVLTAFKKHVRVDEDGRSVVGVDYDNWEKTDAKTFDAFRLAVFRESHRSIQEVSLGATPLGMHSALGQLLFQFRSFVMNAWTKQALHGVAHFDPQTFYTWAFSMMFGSLAYAAQTAINYGNNQRELDRRLDPMEIAKAGFQRAGFSSLVPMAIDTALEFTTGDPLFKFGRSSNLATGFILGNPTVSTAGRIFGLTSAAAQDVFTGDHVWTQKEFMYGAGLLPQVVGIRSALDTMKQEFPKRNYLRSQDQQ